MPAREVMPSDACNGVLDSLLVRQTVGHPRLSPGDSPVMSPPNVIEFGQTMSNGVEDSHSISSDTGSEKPLERGSWGGKLEFFLTCVGFSVGLGNIWRFPYLTFQHGGGAFLIPYIIFFILLGLPMYCLELCMGQFASLGPTAFWRAIPLFKGVGVASLVVSWYIIVYFNVIISWALFFLFSSFASTLPWTTCGNAWNTPACLARGVNVTFKPFSKTPSEEFFYNEVLGRSDGIEDISHLNWRLALLLLLSWIIIFLVLLKGVASLGKVSYVVSTLPYVLLTVFLVRGTTLEGASQGILFYITPDFSKLADISVWGAAATQIFYSTGVCMGNLVAMSSYNKFNNNALRDGMLVPLINLVTSIYSGFAIFSVLGSMAQAQNMEVKDVVAQGPGLVFIVYPEGLAQMPLPQLWAVLFFLMMTFIGYSSQFSYGETLISAIQDEFPGLRRKKGDLIFRAVFCLVGFVCGLPMVTDSGFYIFNILNDYSGSYPLLIIGFLELTAINYVYGFHKFADDIFLMMGRKPYLFLKISWKFTTPAVVLAILIFLMVNERSEIVLEDYMYPDWGFALAWLIAAFPLCMLVLTGLMVFCRKGGYQGLKESMKEDEGWGPTLAENRQGRYAAGSEDANEARAHARKILSMEEPDPAVTTRKVSPNIRINLGRL